jgi:hypothetical protein
MTKRDIKIRIVVPYPRSNVIENMSAPVSPKVVEAILITQYKKNNRRNTVDES